MTPVDVAATVRSGLAKNVRLSKNKKTQTVAHVLIKYPQGPQGHMFAVVVPKIET